MQKLTFKKLFRITLCITTLIVITSVLGNAAHAASVDSGISPIDAFDKLTSANGKWLNSQYRNNYYLDIKTLGALDIFEKGTNGIANILFYLMSMISYICVAAFYFCFNTNVADLFKDIINNMQESLRAGIFDNLFLVAFIFIAIYLVQQLLKRNTVEIFTQILKLLFIIVLSFLLTTETSAVITNSTEIAKTIGAKAVVAINNSESTQSYAADVSGNLWFSLVHEPWLMMEANNKLTEQDQEKILSQDSSSSDRQSYIDNLNSKDSSIFSKDAGTARIAQTFIILILTLLKAGILLLIALVQIAFQVMAILCILLSMVALLLAMVPQLGGMTIIENLAKRIFETQLGIVITTFMLALMTKMDSLIMIDFQKATNCGWLIALIIQTSIYVCMYMFRKKIFNLISIAGKGIKSGHVIPQNFVHNKSRQFAEKTSNVIAGAPRATAHAAGTAVGSTASVAANGIRKVADKVGNVFPSKRHDEKSENPSSDSGNNLNNNIKDNSNEKGNPMPKDKGNDKDNKTKGNGPNLRANLNNKSKEGSSNASQSGSSNRKDSNDIKINDGTKLRQNSSKNNSGENNVKDTTAVGSSKLNRVKNDTGTDNTNSNPQDNETKESRPSLRDNLNNKSKEVTSNASQSESPNRKDNNDIKINDGTKLRQNSSKNNSGENNVKDTTAVGSSKLNRVKNDTGTDNTNSNPQNNEAKESRPSLRNSLNNNNKNNNNESAPNVNHASTNKANSDPNMGERNNLRSNSPNNSNTEEGMKNNFKTTKSESPSQKANDNTAKSDTPVNGKKPFRLDNNIKPKAKANPKTKSDNSNKRETKSKVNVTVISKLNKPNK